jgi:UDP-2,3-diacylglucosamine pyrophosphatase LpxH
MPYGLRKIPRIIGNRTNTEQIMKRTYVISDVHLGSGLESDWFIPSKHQPPLEFMLRKILQSKQESEGEAVELVIAGDLLDTWVCPLETTPPAAEEIIRHNNGIFALLRECAATLDHLYYIPGNHDFHVTSKDLTGWDGVSLIPEYRTGGMRIEHGNSYCIFNAPDPRNDPVHQFPLGYYISRLVAGHPKFRSLDQFEEIFVKLIEDVLHKENLVNDTIDALLEYSDHKETDEFRMPSGCPNITVADVRKIYRNLFHQWEKEYGLDYTLHSITGETIGLEFFYKRDCRLNGTTLMVMGHTHKATQGKTIALSGKETLYANSGTWISGKEPPACVIITGTGRQFEAELLRVFADKTERENIAHLTR